MKKIVILLCITLFYFMNCSIVYAKVDMVNSCENSEIGCAFCVYEYSESVGCYSTFSVTYKSDSTPLEYKTYSSGSNNGSVKCSFNYANFIKNDFIDSSGNVICPNASAKSDVISSSGRTYSKSISFSSSSTGNITPSNSSSIVQKKQDTSNESSNTIEESYSCKYGTYFTVSVLNGSVSVSLNGFDNYTISKSLDPNSFTNNNCPDLWYYINSRGTKSFSIYDKNPGGYFTKITGVLKDENTGEKVYDYDEVEIEPIVPDALSCNELLGSTSCSSGTDCDPAFYLQKAFDVMKYAGIIILIVMSILDFLGAVTSSDEAKVKKAVNRTITRFLLCILIFFVPTILEYIFTWMKIYSPSTCGIN